MREFINYTEIMRVLALSTHPNQLEKRTTKFPDHFVEVDGMVYVSCEYVNALIQYREAVNNLNRLRDSRLRGNDGSHHQIKGGISCVIK